jgi:hypothetical protein
VKRLVRWIARWFGRRRARRLLASGLPRGIDAPRLRGAVRVPRPADGFTTVQVGAQVVRGEPPRTLLRLPALPPPPRDLGKARPDRFRLDEDLRVPPERDAARTAADAPPPVRERTPARPREPLPRAPLSRFDARAFRLERGSLAPANERILPLERPAVDHRWLNPSLKREKVDLPWMARNRLDGLAPRAVEWFVMWWDGTARRPAGAQDPTPWPVPDDLSWLMDKVKEQMLIRRDVVKHEQAPLDGAFLLTQSGPYIKSHEPPPVAELLPDKEWVKTFAMPRTAPVGDSPAGEAYAQWRSLVDLLGDG